MARQRPPVDLEAFERRARQSQRNGHEDDPLAELARIVGDEHDPYGDVFAQQRYRRTRTCGPPSRRTVARNPPSAAARRASPPSRRSRLACVPPRRTRRSMPGHDLQPDYAEPDYSFPPEPQGAGDYAGTHGAMHEAAWAEPARAPAKRTLGSKPALTVAASIAVAVIGIGVAFSYKARARVRARSRPSWRPPARPRSSRRRMRRPTPPTRTTRRSAQGQAPTKLVSREEQPVDLQQAVQDNRDAAGRGTDASSVPVPPSSGQAGTDEPRFSGVGRPDARLRGRGESLLQRPGLRRRHAPSQEGPVGLREAGRHDRPGCAGRRRPRRPRPSRTIASVSSPRIRHPPRLRRRSRRGPRRRRSRRLASPPWHLRRPMPATMSAAAPAPKPAKPGHKAKPVQVAKAETGTEPATGNDTADAGDDASPLAAAPGPCNSPRRPPSRRSLRDHKAHQEVQQRAARSPPRLPPRRQQRPHGLPCPRLEPDERGCIEPLRQAQG